jgi:eukaryotic-like serine/threonine-protein kinase
MAGYEGLPWFETRPILIELADELTASVQDGTLPDFLTLEQIWIEPDGCLQLVDPLGGSSPPKKPIAAESEPNRSALRFLVRAAALALEGGAAQSKGVPQKIRAAVPIHARLILDRLLGDGRSYETIAHAKADLEATRGLPTELGLASRIVRSIGYVGGIVMRVLIAALALLATEKVLGEASAWEVGNGIPPFYWRAAAICLIAWPLWGFATKGGLASRVNGMGLVRADGKIASRFRCAWRELMVWIPLAAILFLLDLLMHRGERWGWSESWIHSLPYFLILWPLLDAGHELFFPGRMLHDRLGGTVRVPC